MPPRAIKKYKQCAIAAARVAGALLCERLGKIKTLAFKGAVNPVTDVDKTSEKLIVSRIKKSFPDHNILTEELLSRDRHSPYTWIIDPLDGTTNYVHRFPFFCVSIALKKNDDIILGVVYDPLREELFYADCATRAQLNGRPIHVSKTSRLMYALVGTGFSYDLTQGRSNNIRNFTKFLYRAQAVRRPGSAALDLCYVACGRFDSFWEMRLKPWDIAAGALIIQKAGGMVTQFDGTRFDCFAENITASNRLLHKTMLRVLGSKKVRPSTP